jgi:hypothetical protein
MTKPDPKPGNSVRQLYPHLSDLQLQEANENVRDYVALAVRVFERLELDQEAWGRFEALTVSRRNNTMNHETSQTNPTTHP